MKACVAAVSKLFRRACARAGTHGACEPAKALQTNFLSSRVSTLAGFLGTTKCSPGTGRHQVDATKLTLPSVNSYHPKPYPPLRFPVE
eukprot:4916765-Pyramimonas_sp.AAC.1